MLRRARDHVPQGGAIHTAPSNPDDLTSLNQAFASEDIASSRTSSFVSNETATKPNAHTALAIPLAPAMNSMKILLLRR